MYVCMFKHNAGLLAVLSVTVVNMWLNWLCRKRPPLPLNPRCGLRSLTLTTCLRRRYRTFITPTHQTNCATSTLVSLPPACSLQPRYDPHLTPPPTLGQARTTHTWPTLGQGMTHTCTGSGYDSHVHLLVQGMTHISTGSRYNDPHCDWVNVTVQQLHGVFVIMLNQHKCAKQQ